MNGNLIDTNIVIKLLGGDETIAAHFETLSDVNIPVVTVGELYYGANRSAPSRRESNRKLFSDFISEYPVLGIDANTASAYSRVKFDLVSSGVNIPENDVWIAAIAISNEMQLITCDKHFANIPGLQSEIL